MDLTPSELAGQHRFTTWFNSAKDRGLSVSSVTNSSATAPAAVTGANPGRAKLKAIEDPTKIPSPPELKANADEPERYAFALMTWERYEFNEEKGCWYSYWKCNRDTCPMVMGVQAKKGYSNLFNHLKSNSCYGEERAKAAYARAMNEKADVDDLRLANKARVVSKWMNLILFEHLPLSKLTSKHFAGIMNAEDRPLVPCPKSMRRYMMNLTELTEKVLRRELPEKFALEHDGWSHNGTHYLAVFAVFTDKRGNVRDALLSMSPLAGRAIIDALRVDVDSDSEDFDGSSGGNVEDRFIRAVDAEAAAKARGEIEAEVFNTDAHYEHLKLVLQSYYGKSMENVVCFLGDNCNLNKKLAKIAKKPLVGCAAHRLNLEVEHWLEDEDNATVRRALEKVNSVFAKARTSSVRRSVRNSGNLLQPILYNKTRWFSKIGTLKRFNAMEPSFTKVPALESELEKITPADRQAMKGALELFEKLHLISLSLQEKDASSQKLALTRKRLLRAKHIIETFNRDGKNRHISSTYTCMYLSDDSAIVDPMFRDFETGVIKLQNNQAADLTDAEREAVKDLLRPRTEDAASLSAPSGTEEVGGSPERRARELRELAASLDEDENRERQTQEYVDCTFIGGTSVRVERFFSQAKLVLPDSRKLMTPYMFEVLCFLRQNARYWDGDTVDAAIQMRMSHRMKTKEDDNIHFIEGRGDDGMPFDYQGDDDE